MCLGAGAASSAHAFVFVCKPLLELGRIPPSDEINVLGFIHDWGGSLPTENFYRIVEVILRGLKAGGVLGWHHMLSGGEGQRRWG